MYNLGEMTHILTTRDPSAGSIYSPHMNRASFSNAKNSLDRQITICLVGTDPVLTTTFMTHLKLFGDTRKHFLMVSSKKHVEPLEMADVVIMCFNRNCDASFEKLKTYWARKVRECVNPGTPLFMVGIGGDEERDSSLCDLAVEYSDQFGVDRFLECSLTDILDLTQVYLGISVAAVDHIEGSRSRPTVPAARLSPLAGRPTSIPNGLEPLSSGVASHSAPQSPVRGHHHQNVMKKMGLDFISRARAKRAESLPVATTQSRQMQPIVNGEEVHISPANFMYRNNDSANESQSRWQKVVFSGLLSASNSGDTTQSAATKSEPPTNQRKMRAMTTSVLRSEESSVRERPLEPSIQATPLRCYTSVNESHQTKNGKAIHEGHDHSDESSTLQPHTSAYASHAPCLSELVNKDMQHSQPIDNGGVDEAKATNEAMYSSNWLAPEASSALGLRPSESAPQIESNDMTPSRERSQNMSKKLSSWLRSPGHHGPDATHNTDNFPSAQRNSDGGATSSMSPRRRTSMRGLFKRSVSYDQLVRLKVVQCGRTKPRSPVANGVATPRRKSPLSRVIFSDEPQDIC